MNDTTTIRLSREAKEDLEKEQLAGETFEETIQRLMGNSKGQVWTEKEIREMARSEVREMIEQQRR